MTGLIVCVVCLSISPLSWDSSNQTEPSIIKQQTFSHKECRFLLLPLLLLLLLLLSLLLLSLVLVLLLVLLLLL